MIQDTEIQTHASDIEQTIELIIDALETKIFDDPDFEDKPEGAAIEKKLHDIANRLWAIKVKLRGDE
jgi:5S rRNA maturation endonuclease (ribonuclease M5)